MGSLYFIIRNTLITFGVVSLMQIQVGSKTLETHIMSFVRKTLAPKILGDKAVELDRHFSQKQIESIKNKVKNSTLYKDATSNMRKSFMDELQKLFNKSKDSDDNNGEAASKQEDRD